MRKSSMFITVAKLKELDKAITKTRKAKASKYYNKQTNEKSHQKKKKEDVPPEPIWKKKKPDIIEDSHTPIKKPRRKMDPSVIDQLTST
ncbi:17957_t:CDS:2, partial [Gigaspora margarita]